MDWVNGFFIPLIEVVFIIGIVGWIGFYVVKAFHNAYTKSWKWFWKYTIRKKAWNETTLKWCLDCMEKGIGWYDAKKLLMVKMLPQDKINETLWIYDQVIIQLNNQGGKNYVREFKGCHSETKSELPSTTG